MNQQDIFIPVFLMLVLTLVIGLRMYATRLPEMYRRNLNPQQVKTRARHQTLGDRADAASDNYINLFELPVVFYALCLSLYVTQRVDEYYLILAYAFTLSRYLHSLIHVTYNKVVHRFLVYVTGLLIVMFMTFRFGFQLLNI